MKIIECPRDAMQGLEAIIPTAVKAAYINTLLKVGFDTIDFGSFVSPKAVPQMQDTAAVLKQLDTEESVSELLAIVANVRGAEQAVAHPSIRYIGFPLSVSETFQQRNTNTSIAASMEVLQTIQQRCQTHNKVLVVYLSMGFGNPYGDPWSADLVAEFTEQVHRMGVTIIALSDTIGSSTPELIHDLFTTLIPAYPTVEFGAHLHARSQEAPSKIAAVYASGCRRIDAAMLGFGGCPFAKDDLVGNIATEQVLAFLEKDNIAHNLSLEAFSEAVHMASRVFPR